MPSIEDLITNYQPTESTIELVKSTKIALLAGISGAGKDTIKKTITEVARVSRYCFSYYARATHK